MSGKGKILGFILSLGICMTASAGPADPSPVTKMMSDGKLVTVHMHGDEFCHWMTDDLGEELVIGTDGRLCRPQTGTLSLEQRLVQARAERAAASASHSKLAPSIGEVHFPVILVAFDNLSFVVDNPLLTFSAHFTDRVADYFVDNSDGKFTPVFDVFGPVTLSNGFGYYGHNTESSRDARPSSGFLEACRLAYQQGMDFSRYDNDGDGYVDEIFFLYAGYNEAQGGPENSIWPHSGSIEKSLREGINDNLFGSVRVDRYSCTSELNGSSGSDMCGIGLICHEFAHSIGLPDLYDTDSKSNGLAEHMYSFSLMAEGEYNARGNNPPYLCTVERMLLGWRDLPEEPSGDVVTLEGMQQGDALTVPTDNPGEFFILECRNLKGRDADIGAGGLLIYHVDMSSNTVGKYQASFLWDNCREYNILNARSAHPCCYAVASSDAGKAAGHIFPGVNEVTSFVPVSWGGTQSSHIIENITFIGGKVYFSHNGPLAEKGINAIFNPCEGKYRAGEKFTLGIMRGAVPANSVEWYLDGSPASGPTVTLKAGEHTVTAVLHFDEGEEVLEQTIEVK